MTQYYVTHTDSHGERHQIGDAFEAKTPQDALNTILEQAGADDDGNYEVFEDLLAADDDTAALEALAAEVKGAKKLSALRDALVAFERAADKSNSLKVYQGSRWEISDFGVDICELPTFGGEQPKSTAEVWSWDEDCLLAGTGPFSEWEIVDRSDD
jgi:hypothetical protein